MKHSHSILAALLLCLGLISAFAAEEYCYGFVLTCDKSIEFVTDHPLSPQELLNWYDFFENTECPPIVNP